ncbi:hypothetical protein C2G38_2127843 [Gigaspora rosea]|uniref:RZ-type domain-containing protein n=1 Tax=Gigaspora rosea TaxID=44941 RepID=A0A397TTA2_9GLOM|nr:hypothetical protein C2G38_2127843 [Gigaspora rosea]
MENDFQEHWYECPKGHLYLCGSAVQTNCCLDCGEPVGGQNHTIATGNSRNSRNEEFDNI